MPRRRLVIPSVACRPSQLIPGGAATIRRWAFPGSHRGSGRWQQMRMWVAPTSTRLSPGDMESLVGLYPKFNYYNLEYLQETLYFWLSI
jgi:hypothetical protein